MQQAWNVRTYPSRILLADMGPVDSFFFLDSPSADTVNKSRTSPVFIDPRPEFCCVMTDDAIFNLNRCSLIPFVSVARTDSMPV